SGFTHSNQFREKAFGIIHVLHDLGADHLVKFLVPQGQWIGVADQAANLTCGGVLQTELDFGDLALVDVDKGNRRSALRTMGYEASIAAAHIQYAVFGSYHEV